MRKARAMAKWKQETGPSPKSGPRPSQAGPKPAARQERRPPPAAQRKHDPDVSWLYGFHSVQAALNAGARKLIRLYATKEAALRLKDEIGARGLETTLLTAAEIDRLAPREAVHQGLLLEARPLPPVTLEDLPGKGVVLVLDQISDPHNVGAILRTAAAFAIDALVVTERHSPEFSGVLAKAASGGLEHVPVAAAGNLSRALTELGEMGYLRIGLDSDGTADLAAIPLSAPLALVLGAEGKGLRRLTRERCDAVARLDLPGAVKSLNVSNACAVALSIARSRLPIPG